MKRFATLLIIATLTFPFSACASTSEPVPPPPMPAPEATAHAQQQTVEVNAQTLNRALELLQKMAIENARPCKGAIESLTWHCDAQPVLQQLIKELQEQQNKKQATEKGK